ncbi:MAG: RDD family protein [Thiomargarita sp.]|nr:RDD family protein [Thiomargarita sp.]
MLDTTRPVETPEGIELGLRVAGPVVRALAWCLDFALRILIYMILLYFFTTFNLGDLGIGLFLISIFILEWFYPVLFEVYRDGATPGKQAMHIKVLHESGVPVNWSNAMVRNLLRAVDFLPFLYGFGLISMLMNHDFKRIGDLAAGTVVVYEEEHVSLKKDTAWMAESPVSLPVPLTLEEQQALINFADRSSSLPESRLIELANIVTPLTGTSGKRGVKMLYQFANSLIGNK